MSKLWQFQNRYPVVRSMAAYAAIWPSSSIFQEYLDYGTPLYRANWDRAVRYSIFGAIFMCPVCYTWMKFTSPYFKKKTLRTAVTRATIELFTYGPLAIAYFLFGMSLLEGKGIEASTEQVKKKFWPVYKTGFFFWPTIQTINFRFIPDKSQAIFVSIASFFWTAYLAHASVVKV